MPITACHPFGDRSSALQTKFPAALLTRMSMRPKASIVRDHAIHLIGMPHVNFDRERLSAGASIAFTPSATCSGSGWPERRCAPSDTNAGDREADARSATGDQRGLSLEQVGREHRTASVSRDVKIPICSRQQLPPYVSLLRAWPCSHPRVRRRRIRSRRARTRRAAHDGAGSDGRIDVCGGSRRGRAAIPDAGAGSSAVAGGLNTAARPAGVVRTVYEFAARHPEVLHYVPCFCGCERGRP